MIIVGYKEERDRITREIHAKVDTLIRAEGPAKVLERLEGKRENIIIKKLEESTDRQTDHKSTVYLHLSNPRDGLFPYDGSFITRKQLREANDPSTARKDTLDKNPKSTRKSQLHINLKHCEVRIADKTFLLAERRFKMFCLLICNERPVERESILIDLWGSEQFDSKIVDVTVARLRHDLRSVQEFINIQTTRYGYELKIKDSIL